MNPRGRLEATLWHAWQRPLAPAAQALLPLEWLYRALATRRRRRAAARAPVLPVPVVVVGNITVGGSGKTPLLIALAAALRARGLRVGVLCRGHGGRAGHEPAPVPAGGDAALWGDEAVLLAERVDGPVWIGRDRVRAARALCAAAPLDLVLADDGLQHYRLARAMEICVIDGTRGLGNGHCLPLGPLREPPARLRECDAVIATGAAAAGVAVRDGVMGLEPVAWRRVRDNAELPLGALARGERVHAVAGIGNPARFFATLRALGLEVLEHPFADHHPFRARELAFADGLRVVMTEKDAVKCRRFAAPDWLALRVEAQLPASLADTVRRRIAEFSPRNPA